MKILYIVHTNAVGGSNNALFNILGYMKERHDVRVLFPKPSNGQSVVQDYLERNHIRYYNPYFYDAFVYGKDRNVIRRFIRTVGRFYRHLRMRKKIKGIIDDFKPDIVHTNNGIIDIALDYCRKKGIPHVWHLREYQDLDFKMSVMPSKSVWLKRIHRQGNYNIAITKGIFDYFQLRDCDTYIYDGVLDLSVPSMKKKEKSDYFLFVAGIAFAQGKGLLDALKAFGKFAENYKEYKLYVAGSVVDNSYKAECDAFIQSNNLADKVGFLGVRSDVNELMAASIATLVPSRFEGFGFITVEAMYNGSLVIGRNTAGTKEQFDRGLEITGEEIGMRFNDADELVLCMKKAVNEDTADMRQRAKTVVERLYTIDGACRNLDNYYKRIFSDRLKK